MNDGLNFRQRWATFLTIGVTVMALLAGLLLRSSVEGATQLFVDSATGIAARYPADWLLERGAPGADFVFRVEDPTALAFKTTLSVSIQPIGPNATVYDVAELLTLKQAQTLAAYHYLGLAPIQLANGTAATRLSYAYAASAADPFLGSVPVVVQADDVIVLSHGQAIVAGYQSDAQSYAANQRYFVAFLRALTY
jgi:hypothetical protein